MSSNRGPSNRRVELIDLILGYACNSACIFCALDDRLRGRAMTPRQALSKLLLALDAHPGAKVRIGGGEPTVRGDLTGLVRLARDRGAPAVSIQTNGYRLADPTGLERLAGSGLTKVNLSLRSVDPETYERLTGQAGAHRLAWSAFDRILAAGLEIEIDALVSLPFLAEADRFALAVGAAGGSRINFWFISAEGRAACRTAELVPTLTATANAIEPLFARHPGLDLRVFYVPCCAFPDHPERVWNPLSENTLVVTPDSSFMLEKGAIDIGRKTDRCNGCAWFDRCPGVRANYLALHGDAELRRFEP